MSKTLIVVFALLACTFAATPFEQIKDVIQQDQCGMQAMETIRPKLENKIEELKTVQFYLNLEPQWLES